MSSEEEGYGARANEGHEPELEEEPVAVKILTRKGLVEFLRSFQRLAKGDILAVGLVGYPNVGKSSTINSLMSAKKTSVSSTPGKTKHFQVSPKDRL
jgi:ribosome biogenesis GTPase A